MKNGKLLHKYIVIDFYFLNSTADSTAGQATSSSTPALSAAHLQTVEVNDPGEFTVYLILSIKYWQRMPSVV